RSPQIEVEAAGARRGTKRRAAPSDRRDSEGQLHADLDNAPLQDPHRTQERRTRGRTARRAGRRPVRAYGGGVKGIVEIELALEARASNPDRFGKPPVDLTHTLPVQRVRIHQW